MDTHKDFMSEYDEQHQDEKHTNRVNAPVEKKWGKTYVSKLKSNEQSMTSSDRERLKSKERLAEIIELDKVNLDLRLGGLSSEFKDVLSAITAYTKINANAVDGDYEAEQKVLLNAMQVNMKFIIAMQTKQQEKELSSAETGMLNRAIQYDKFFSSEHDGNLEIPKDAVIKTTNDKDIVCKKDLTDKKKQLLFPHDPSVNDISQGGLGDCYLLAALASVVATQPMKIKECMRDNNDGTATVRFYKKVDENTMTPVFVRVTKTTPDAFSENSLWVQIMEKAFAASNLHRHRNPVTKEDQYITEAKRAAEDKIPEWENKIKDLKSYIKSDEYKSLSKEKKQEKDTELKNSEATLERFIEHSKLQESSYETIDGGYTGVFLETLLGQQHKMATDDFTKQEAGNSNAIITSIYKAVNPVERDQEFSSRIVSDTLDSLYDKQKPEGKTLEQFKAENLRIYSGRIHSVMNSVLGSIYGLANKDAKTINIKELVIQAIDKAILDNAQNPTALPEVKADLLNMIKIKLPDLFSDEPLKVYFKPLSGDYHDAQLNAFEKIKTNLAAGKIINASTKEFKSSGSGLNGETHAGGLFGPHAYTVLGTETREIAGKAFHFIKLRNPWGSSIEQYTEEEGQLKERSEKSGNNGVFLCELSRFLTVYNDVSYN